MRRRFDQIVNHCWCNLSLKLCDEALYTLLANFSYSPCVGVARASRHLWNKHLGMLMLITTREVIITALYCKHWSFPTRASVRGNDDLKYSNSLSLFIVITGCQRTFCFIVQRDQWDNFITLLAHYCIYLMVEYLSHDVEFRPVPIRAELSHIAHEV